MENINPDIVKVLITEEAIQQRVVEMGKEIAEAYSESVPLLIGVLKGCSLFMADLIRQMDIALEMDYIAVLSYTEAQQTSGAVRIVKDLDCIVEGRDLLIMEGIVDTGMTIGYILRNLQARQPRSMRLCTLLDKPARRIVPVPIDFKGFEIPDHFVVGYGLDYRQRYRNLPYIGILKDEITGLAQGKKKINP